MKNRVIVFLGAMLVLALSVGLVSSAKTVSFEESFTSDAELVPAKTGTYKFDVAHSAIGFKVKHMGLVFVPGYFKKFEGTVNYNAEDVTRSSVKFKAEAASVDTRVERRDAHLRSPDFFDVKKHPDITFKSTKVEQKGDVLHVTGDFTLHETTKSIKLPVKVAGFKEGRGNSVIMGATSKTSIKRSEYGITYGIRNIGDEVMIELNIEAR